MSEQAALCLAERADVAYFMRRLYRQKLTTTSGGNISCRCPDGSIAITASRLDKCELTADGVGLVSPEGAALTPELRLSIETGMHLAIYRCRPDVKAIVHAHAVTATAFCCAQGLPLDTTYTAEAYAILGRPVFVPYALMGSAELAEAVAEGLTKADCGLLENHGVIAVGGSLLEAFDRLELLEQAAQHTLMVQQIGRPSALTAERLAELDRFVGRA